MLGSILNAILDPILNTILAQYYIQYWTLYWRRTRWTRLTRQTRKTWQTRNFIVEFSHCTRFNLIRDILLYQFYCDLINPTVLVSLWLDLTTMLTLISILLNYLSIMPMLFYVWNMSFPLLQCRCSCQFFVHSSLYCAVKPCGRKLRENKYTQPLIVLECSRTFYLKFGYGMKDRKTEFC